MKIPAIKLQIPDKILEKLNRLFLSWGVGPNDWAVATEAALQRQGYAIFDDKNPYEIDLWIKISPLPWKAESGWMTLPPKGSKELDDLERFVKNTGYSLHMVPTSFAGFNASRLNDAASYTLSNGKIIRLLTPPLYIEQLTDLVTHPLTKEAFFLRIPKLKARAEDILAQAKEKGDKVVIAGAKNFLKICAKLTRNKKIKSTNLKSLSAIPGRVTGQGVGRKTVTGKARLILHARDFGKMKKGEILVTFDTNPEFLIILRKMKAIVTDNGGISCHAAIIAREFDVPAVVGTQIATKVFKTGDLIEVNSSNGIVSKI